MAKLSLLLGAGLLMAIAGLFGGASAIKSINQPTPLALGACDAKDDVQRVQFNYNQDQVYEVYVPLNGKWHTLSVDSNLPQLKCTYVELGTCHEEDCDANPITLQVLDPSDSTSCILKYSTLDGTKHRTLTGGNGPSKIPPGWFGTISCQPKSTLPRSRKRDVQYRETASSNTPSLNATAHDGLDGCIGRSDDPDVQRIDWYFEDRTRYTLFIMRDAKPNIMDPPEVKCAYQQPGGTWACGPCNKRFSYFDIDTRDTLCQILLDRGDGSRKFDVKLGYGWWKVENGCHPDKIACWKDEDEAAKLAKLLVDGGGDTGFGLVQRIEPPADLLQSPTFPTAEDFVFIDGVRVKD